MYILLKQSIKLAELTSYTAYIFFPTDNKDKDGQVLKTEYSMFSNGWCVTDTV